MNFKLIKKRFLLAVLLVNFLFSCKNEAPIDIETNDFFKSVDKVTEIMVHDIFSPPVASRVYVYPNIAAYEIIAQKEDYNSLAGQLTNLTAIPKIEQPNVHIEMAALMAHLELSKKLIFSEDKLMTYRDSLYSVWEDKNSTQFKATKSYATQVVSHIEEWMNQDHYAQTRTMPKYTVNTNDPSRWQPTPPSYMDAIEPNWNKIRPMVLDSASQFKPEKHPEFSLKKNTAFFKELTEVYTVSKEITKKGDNSEEIQIAQFWDCNPYVSVTRGHLMFASKKITPGAHWIGITKIACQKNTSNFDDTVATFTKTSIGIFDGFISCWDEKYRSNLIRPETLINEHIDEEWKPILQTPPFPEYTSGHSVVSGAASTILTSIFGDDFAFDDTTEIPYGLPVRSFPSFNKAADEAAMSRLYGGIHYMAAIVNGLSQGRNIGSLVVNNVQLKPSKE